MSEEMMQTSPFECPAWFDGKKINETVFCEEFLRDYPMVTVNDAFFTVNALTLSSLAKVRTDGSGVSAFNIPCMIFSFI